MMLTGPVNLSVTGDCCCTGSSWWLFEYPGKVTEIKSRRNQEEPPTFHTPIWQLESLWKTEICSKLSSWTFGKTIWITRALPHVPFSRSFPEPSRHFYRSRLQNSRPPLCCHEILSFSANGSSWVLAWNKKHFIEHLKKNLFWHYLVRDRKHAESVYEKCKGESLYIKLYFAPDSLYYFSLLWTEISHDFIQFW